MQLSKILRVFSDVKILRILVAGLIGVAAMLATLFAAVIVVFTGICAYLVHFFRRQGGPGPGPAPTRSQSMNRAGSIDVVATDVPDGAAGTEPNAERRTLNTER